MGEIILSMLPIFNLKKNQYNNGIDCGMIIDFRIIILEL